LRIDNLLQKPRVVCTVGALAAVATILAPSGNAQVIQGELWQNQTVAAENATLAQAAGLGAPDAKFTVTTGFNFNPSDSGANYTPNLFLGSPTFTSQSANFSARASGYGPNAGLDNTYFYFTGSLFLNAGANSFIVGHDSGVQLNIEGIGLVVNAPGPTALAETPFTVTAPTAGTYTFELAYGECCGPPASLVWEINQKVGAPDAVGGLGNVRASQRAGTTLVDLFYDLTGNGSAYTASPAVSSDAGASFTVPATHFTGDGVTSPTAAGTGLHIVWDAGADFPGQFSTRMRLQLVVNGAASAVSPIFTLDTRAVPTGTLTGHVQGNSAPVANAQVRIKGTVFAGNTDSRPPDIEPFVS